MLLLLDLNWQFFDLHLEIYLTIAGKLQLLQQFFVSGEIGLCSWRIDDVFILGSVDHSKGKGVPSKTLDKLCLVDLADTGTLVLWFFNGLVPLMSQSAPFRYVILRSFLHWNHAALYFFQFLKKCSMFFSQFGFLLSQALQHLFDLPYRHSLPHQ